MELLKLEAKRAEKPLSKRALSSLTQQEREIFIFSHFVVLDPRSDKMASSSREEVHSRQRSLLTEQQKESLDAFVLTARNRVNGQDESHQQRHQEEVQKKEKLKPEVKERVPRTQKSRPSQQVQTPKQSAIRAQAYGRMEAYRRMKRGMAIARAFQGYPAGLLLRQLTALANEKRYEDQQRTRML